MSEVNIPSIPDLGSRSDEITIFAGPCSVESVEQFDEVAGRSAARQTNYTAGVVWQPVKYLRCQLNYTYEDYASRAAANRNVVSLMLSGIF